MLTLITALFYNHFKESEFDELGVRVRVPLKVLYVATVHHNFMLRLNGGRYKKRELGRLPWLWDTRKYTVVSINSYLFASLEKRCMISIKLNLFNLQEPSPAVNGNVNVKSCFTFFYRNIVSSWECSVVVLVVLVMGIMIAFQELKPLLSLLLPSCLWHNFKSKILSYSSFKKLNQFLVLKRLPSQCVLHLHPTF